MLASVRRSRVLFPSVTEIMELRRWTSLANGPGALLASGSSVLESQRHTATLAFLKRSCRDHTSALTLVWQILHHLSHFPSQGFFFFLVRTFEESPEQNDRRWVAWRNGGHLMPRQGLGTWSWGDFIHQIIRRRKDPP